MLTDLILFTLPPHPTKLKQADAEKKTAKQKRKYVFFISAPCNVVEV